MALGSTTSQQRRPDTDGSRDMPVNVIDLDEGLDALLAGDLAALDVDIVSPNTPDTITWGEAVRSSIQALIGRDEGIITDIDRTAEATSNWVTGGAGTYSVGGVNWTVANTTAADTFGLVGGTGLRFNANATNGTYHTTTRTAPYLRVPVTTLVPTFDPMATYVIEVYVSSATLGTNGNRIVFGIENDTAGTDRMLCGGRRNASGTQQTYATIDTAASIQGSSATHTAIALRVNADGVSAFSGTYSGGAFPDPYAFSAGHLAHADSVVNAMGGDTTNYFFIAFASGETGAAMDCTLARYRIRRVR